MSTNESKILDTLPAPTRTVLDGTPQRVVTFLGALGMQPAIMAALQAAGYSQRDHDKAWSLLATVLGYTEAGPPAPENAAVQAIHAIDDWEAGGFVRAEAALKHHHPEQARFVFDGLTAARGPASVAAMVVFLDRLDALERGPARKATRKADHAALATLAVRGIDASERQRLRELVATASAFTLAPVPPSTYVTAAQERRSAALLALYRWHEDWSSTARVVVTRRRDLIRLGLAKPRQKKAAATTPPTPITPPAPPPAAPVAGLEEEPIPPSRAA